MSLFSRACTLFVVFGALGIGACASPSGPSAMVSSKSAQGQALVPSSARDVSSGLTMSALSKGVTDTTLMNAGWSCLEPGPGVTVAHNQASAFLRFRPFPITVDHRVTPSRHSSTTSSIIT